MLGRTSATRPRRQCPRGWGPSCQPAASPASAARHGYSGTSHAPCLRRVLCPFPSCSAPLPTPTMPPPPRAPSRDARLPDTVPLGRGAQPRPPRHPPAPWVTRQPTEQCGMGKALRSSTRRGRRRQPSGRQRMAGGHRRRQRAPEDGGTVPGWVPRWRRRGPANSSEEGEKGEERG